MFVIVKIILADISIGGYLPKHPEFSNIDKRKASFSTWPEYMVQKPDQLALAGFYFTGRICPK